MKIVIHTLAMKGGLIDMPKARIAREIFRFAHPFFTTTPIDQRAAIPGIGRRLSDFTKGRLHRVPESRRKGRMALSDIIGSSGEKEIEKAGIILFQAVGDSGRTPDSPEQVVSDMMAADFDVNQPARSPAFFLHLGDVIYGPNKEQSYRREFYEPYMRYPGKIIAIPGNHDGETFPKTDPVPLKAFIQNFCATTSKIPAIAGSIFRETMTLPGVYWLLETPFVDIVGLDSNSAENPGFISGPGPGNVQKRWLISTLEYVAGRRNRRSPKALIMATHHPPFSQGGHSGSGEMLADIDDACRQAGIYPDLFLSGHAHSYQRYAREMTVANVKKQIPFIVAGTGGVGEQQVPEANGQHVGEATYEKSFKGYGFLLLKASRKSVEVEYFSVETANGTRTSFDKIEVEI